MRIIATSAVMACLCVTGCMRRHVEAPVMKAHAKAPGTRNYYVGKECGATAHLMNCDTASPPHCQFEKVIFTKGCEQLEVSPLRKENSNVH